VATGASQSRNNSIWLTGEALVFSGGGSVLPSCRVTMQSGRSMVSPTVVETTTDWPAPVRADLASLYFCPTTSGGEAAACATTPPKTITALTAVVMLALSRTALLHTGAGLGADGLVLAWAVFGSINQCCPPAVGKALSRICDFAHALAARRLETVLSLRCNSLVGSKQAIDFRSA
jgi:hypothetical protein